MVAVLHQDRLRAESFGAAAERYDRTRPQYPEELIAAVLDGQPGAQVLDVGCGTGIAAIQFARHGAHVLGIEPDARMAALARAKGLEVEVSPFEQWDPAGRTFDVVTAGQSWHWVDPTDGPAKAAAVLRSGGRLATFWNKGEPPPDLVARFDEVYRRLAPGTDGYSVLLGYANRTTHDPQFDGIAACPDLHEPLVRTFPWERRYSRDEWLDQLPTHSDHARLPADRLEEVLTAVGRVIDDFGGSFTMHYEAALITATR